MKRSEINAIMREAVAFIKGCGFHLPPFAYWSPDEWTSQGAAADGIKAASLGWDITDFGSGNFAQQGLFLFTIRNGVKGSNREYAEKIMVVRENQITPMHFHFKKTEDIINRGGGNLIVKLYNADTTEGLADTPVTVITDGVVRQVAAGDSLVLTPGESITLEPRMYHTFHGEPGKGTVLVGEVSAVNDDSSDNRFYDEIGRFPAIEENEPPLYPLCFEYT